jgi:glycosyltransferase involved in cell wall biosynthesis
MAAGLPVVTTSVRGLSEIVTDGRNGFLVEPENPAQLAERIQFLLSDDVLRKKISARNLAWVEQHTWEKVVDMLEGAYSEVV